jgi:SpoVK/Ycf46/Vps4 family AAA+-type ATPase
LAENDYETELATSVVRAKDIGIRFDQIGALDDVKTTLKELIILPLKRPELFSKGNLRKVHKDFSTVLCLFAY